MFDAIIAIFVPPRAVPPDRQYERAIAEIGSLDAADAARPRAAPRRGDVARRRVPPASRSAKLENADPLVVQKPWTRSLEDSSRAVRRAAIRAMAHVARPTCGSCSSARSATRTRACATTALRGLVARSASAAPNRASNAASRDDDLRSASAASAPPSNGRTCTAMRSARLAVSPWLSSLRA